MSGKERNTAIGQLIQSARMERGLSLYGVARNANCSEREVDVMENGYIDCNDDAFIRVCNFLKVNWRGIVRKPDDENENQTVVALDRLTDAVLLLNESLNALFKRQ